VEKVKKKNREKNLVSYSCPDLYIHVHHLVSCEKPERNPKHPNFVKKKSFNRKKFFFCSTNPSCKTGVIDEGINVGRRQINQRQK
jgi:ssDNA-binding Zn-finger/Zn-ribbon topoisomerase 1